MHHATHVDASGLRIGFGTNGPVVPPLPGPMPLPTLMVTEIQGLCLGQICLRGPSEDQDLVRFHRPVAFQLHAPPSNTLDQVFPLQPPTQPPPPLPPGPAPAPPAAFPGGGSSPAGGGGTAHRLHVVEPGGGFVAP